MAIRFDARAWRAARRVPFAVVLLSLPALGGCGSDEEPRVQQLAFCQGPSGDTSQGDSIEVEFRQGDTVVASTSGAVGTVFTVEVPPGGVRIYVDGTFAGSVNEGVDFDGPRP